MEFVGIDAGTEQHMMTMIDKEVKPKRVEVLDVPVDCVTMDQALDWVETMIAGHHKRSIMSVNPEKVMRARRDPKLLDQLRGADLLIPDGIGVVLALRLLGLRHAERVTGCDLMPNLCERAASKGYKVFIFGATSEVNQRCVSVLRARYPGITIVGALHGYIKQEDMDQAISMINDCQPDFLFVALGTPYQEEWMARHLSQLNVKVCQGVGGTLDVIAGRVKRAPAFLRAMHLEWFYRLVSQPRRIARQIALLTFALHVIRKLVIG